MPSCVICSKEDAVICTECYSESYCSIDCKSKDYPTHRWLCSELKNYQHRPHNHMRRGILFHEMQKPPQWVWIVSESQCGEQCVVLEPHLKVPLHGETEGEVIFMYHNHPSRRAPQDALAIIYHAHGDLGPNRSIQALDHGATARPWYGPLIAMKKLGLQTDPGADGDMDLTAYRNVVDSLIHRLLPIKEPVFEGNSEKFPWQSARMVQGVRINCTGDVHDLGAKYVPFELSVLHPVFVADKPKSCELVGVPIRIQKIPPPLGCKISVPKMRENEVVTRLFQGVKPGDKDFGLVPPQWDVPVGSVLVAREDGRDITAKQVEALCHFIGEQGQKILTGPRVKVGELLALLTPDEFRKFFASFKAEKEVNDLSWTTAVSPI